MRSVPRRPSPKGFSSTPFLQPPTTKALAESRLQAAPFETMAAVAALSVGSKEMQIKEVDRHSKLHAIFVKMDADKSDYIDAEE